MSSPQSGFTLVEISIVLIVTAVVAGGILVGKDLMTSASLRGQIAQIQQYQVAVNTFSQKYGGLPGDLSPKLAARYGFWPRGGGSGQGDGNGVIEGAGCGDSMHPGQSYFGTCVGAGELAVFFSDLSYANGRNINLIDQSFPGPTINDNFMLGIEWVYDTHSQSGISQLFPKAKLGGNTYVYPWSGGFAAVTSNASDGVNYFEVDTIEQLNGGVWTTLQADNTRSHGVTVMQAYSIDQKMDDGLPTTGNVKAITPNNGGVVWSAAYCIEGGSCTYPAADTATSCFNFTNLHYSTGINNGSGLNCDLSFAFQQ